MNSLLMVVVLGALSNAVSGNSTAESVDGGQSDLKSRLGNSLGPGPGSFHGLGGINFDLVKYVISGIRTGTSDVLAAVPTQVGRGEHFGFNGLNDNAVVPGYQFARPPPPPYPVPLPPSYKGGGYRGVKSLPVAPVGGGYRGVSPAAVIPVPAVPAVPAQAQKKPSAVERPSRPVLPLDVIANVGHPDRDGRFDKGPSWRPELLVDKSEVIREDKDFRPVQPPAGSRPGALFRPDSGVRPVREPKPRPAVVPVTDDGPPSKDFISKLEADLVAGLTPQQLEELSFQAIDPRTVESKASKQHSGTIIFPGRVVR